MDAVEIAATTAANNTTELLTIITATKGAAAIVKKHGPRMVAFAFGLASAFGLGNPKVNAFVAGFFGG